MVRPLLAASLLALALAGCSRGPSVRLVFSDIPSTATGLLVDLDHDGQHAATRWSAPAGFPSPRTVAWLVLPPATDGQFVVRATAVDAADCRVGVQVPTDGVRFDLARGAPETSVVVPMTPVAGPCNRIDGGQVTDAGAACTPVLDGGTFTNLTSWTRQTGNRSSSVWGIPGGGLVYVANPDGYLDYRIGTQWNGKQTTGGLTAVWGSGGGLGDRLYAAGPNRLMFLSIGSTDLTDFTPAPPSIDTHAIWGTGPNDFYLVGGGGQIRHFTGTWSVPASTETFTLWRMWGSSATDLYIVGSATTILHSTDGTTWIRQPYPTTAGLPDLRGVWGSSPCDVYVAGGNQTILHSTGDGTWTVQSFKPNSETLRTVWGSSGGDVFAAGDNGLLLHSRGDGVWTTFTIPNAATADFNDLWGTGPSDIWGALSDGVYHLP